MKQLASSQATPTFYLTVVEKNWEKAWDQYYVMDRKWWTRFRNDGNMPTQYVAGSSQFKCFVNSYGLHRYQVTNKQCVDISGRRYACTLTERDRESSRLRVSVSSVCTLATIIKEAHSQD